MLFSANKGLNFGWIGHIVVVVTGGISGNESLRVCLSLNTGIYKKHDLPG
ncbi:MAG: hypothetical protein PF482_12195 [Desulfobacteraceae bacterium]|jgi:hypothetical protein|nr:hypothetical protein [Desulfobacteraceae bacterium]